MAIATLVAIGCISATASLKAQSQLPYDYLDGSVVPNTDLSQIPTGQITYSVGAAPATLALVLNVQVPSLANHPNFTSEADSQSLTNTVNWYTWLVNRTTGDYYPTTFNQLTGTAISTTKYGNKEFLRDIAETAGLGSINGWSLIAIPSVSNGVTSYSMVCSNTSSGLLVPLKDDTINLLQVSSTAGEGFAPLAQVSSTTGGIGVNNRVSALYNIRNTGSSTYYTVASVSIGGDSDAPQRFMQPNLTQAQQNGGVTGPISPLTLNGLYSAKAINTSWITSPGRINVLPVPGLASFNGLVGTGTTGTEDNSAPVTATGTLQIAASKAVKGLKP